MSLFCRWCSLHSIISSCHRAMFRIQQVLWLFSRTRKLWCYSFTNELSQFDSGLYLVLRIDPRDSLHLLFCWKISSTKWKLDWSQCHFLACLWAKQCRLGSTRSTCPIHSSSRQLSDISQQQSLPWIFYWAQTLDLLIAKASFDPKLCQQGSHLMVKN